jgi:hypothetical protein
MRGLGDADKFRDRARLARWTPSPNIKPSSSGLDVRVAAKRHPCGAAMRFAGLPASVGFAYLAAALAVCAAAPDSLAASGRDVRAERPTEAKVQG